jgi:hypothetical protein
MLNKFMLVFVMAFSLVSVAGAAPNPQNPLPPCYPCDGGGN